MLVRKYSRPNHAKSHFAGKIVIPGMKPEIVKWNRPLKVQMCVWGSRCAEHNFERRLPLYDFFYSDTKYCREHLSVCVWMFGNRNKLFSRRSGNCTFFK